MKSLKGNIFFKNTDLKKNINKISNVFNKYGVVVIDNFFKSNGNKSFEIYKKDLTQLFNIIKKKTKYKSLSEVRRKDPKLLGRIVDLGSKPNNIISGIELKVHPNMLKLSRKLLNTKLLGTMNTSDRLFYEGNSKYEKQYFQNIHNDYNYVFQSKNALTASIGLSSEKCSGGVDVYLKSHKLNFKVKKDKNERPQIQNKDLKKLKKFEKVFISHKYGRVTFFHTFTYHCTVQNKSNNLRVAQIFRYSDLNSIDLEKFSYKGKKYSKSTGRPIKLS